MTMQKPIPAPAPPEPTDTPEVPARVTPMMEQYLEIKAANPELLLFYRMGDFYELFFEDAEIAAKALGIVLTKRGKHCGDDIPMCGVPVERAQEYLHRLIGLGHRVAVCEQVEDPAEARKRGGKSVVLKLVVDADILVGGMIFSLAMGCVGGLVPALSAMRLKPLEAVR